MSFRDVVKQTNATINSAVAHAVVPFVKVVEVVSPERDTSRTPIFQTMLTWEEDLCHTSVEIALSLKEHHNCSMIEGYIEYNSDLYDRSTIEAMARRFELLLERMVRSAEIPLHEVSVLSDAERELVLTTWNETEQPYPESATAHGLYESQARASPDAVALVFEGEEVTYGELLVYTSSCSPLKEKSETSILKSM